ncbi:MAG TPA: HIT family protein [Pyrinomonadaceae bacterium]|jgi:histidine triad (HIT) family protein|nr:HIT family protein [Pyrinomonadaceae bacterium]
MSDTCLFCRIVSGEGEAAVVYEDEESLAFLDHRPLFAGHCLVIPRKHCETLTDLPVSAVGTFFRTVQLLARAVESAMEAEGTFVAMNNRVSQSVPHLHVHVVPRKKKDGLKGFFWPRSKYQSREEMLEVGQRITTGLERLS